LAQDYRDAFVDEQAHASLATAARAACIRVVTYPHGSVPELPQTGGMAVMTDGVFGARGTLAPIGPLVEALAPRARLLVDDCHGVGVLGPRGCGSLSAAGVDDPRVVVTASLAKAIGVAGGVVAADHSFVERLRQSSATFRGSTPIPPAIAMGASVALSILENEPRLVSSLRRNVERVHSLLLELQVDPGARDVPVFTIVPASAQHAARLDSAFKRSGLLIPLIDYPGGPARSYFRIAVSAAHTEQDLDRLEQTLRQSLAVVESDDGATGER
jgi:8-amino-7-oxononanoate synthase